MTQTPEQARKRIAQLLPCNGFLPAEVEQRRAKAAQIADRHGIRLEYAELLRPGEVQARPARKAYTVEHEYAEYDYSDLEAEYAVWRAAELAQMFRTLERERERRAKAALRGWLNMAWLAALCAFLLCTLHLVTAYVLPASGPVHALAQLVEVTVSLLAGLYFMGALLATLEGK